jgi:hypothetical protein
MNTPANPPIPVAWFELDSGPRPPPTVALMLRPGAVVSGQVYRSLNTVMLSHPGDQLMIVGVPGLRFDSVSWPGRSAPPAGISVEVREDRVVLRADSIPATPERAEYAIALSVGGKSITLDPIIDRDGAGGGPSVTVLN